MTAPVETYTSMLPLQFEAPPLNPSPQGLHAATIFTEVTGPSRHLSGVEIRPAGNYGGSSAFGVWDADWCAVPPLISTPRKEGTRPDGLDPFAPMTVWAYDECDLTAPSRADVVERRAMQIFRLEEQNAVERELSNRLLTDAGTPSSAADLQWAVATIEAAFAKTNTLGFIHAGAQWATYAAQSQLLVRASGGFTSPLGHRWIFGGGYVEGLQSTLIATSQPYGWRDDVQVRTAIDERHNTFAAIAERTVAVGYEHLIAAVTITP